MKKIQIFTDNNPLALQTTVNEWLSKNNVDVLEISTSTKAQTYIVIVMLYKET